MIISRTLHLISLHSLFFVTNAFCMYRSVRIQPPSPSHWTSTEQKYDIEGTDFTKSATGIQYRYGLNCVRLSNKVTGELLSQFTPQQDSKRVSYCYQGEEGRSVQITEELYSECVIAIKRTGQVSTNVLAAAKEEDRATEIRAAAALKLKAARTRAALEAAKRQATTTTTQASAQAAARVDDSECSTLAFIPETQQDYPSASAKPSAS